MTDRTIYMIDHDTAVKPSLREAVGDLYACQIYNYWLVEEAIGTDKAELCSTIFVQSMDIILQMSTQCSLPTFKFRLHALRGTKKEIICTIEDALISLHYDMLKGPDERDYYTLCSYISVLIQLDAIETLTNTLHPDSSYPQDINAIISHYTGLPMTV